jgi:hypothetical protein
MLHFQETAEISFPSRLLKMPEPKGNGHFQMLTAFSPAMRAAREVNIGASDRIPYVM